MKFTKSLITRLVREEVQNIFREQEDEKGSDDEVQSAKDQGMRSDVERVAKFMFKHPQLSKALTKIKGNVEAAQLLGLLAQELGVDPSDISAVMSKVKKGMGDKEEGEEEAAADAKKAGGGEEGLEENNSASDLAAVSEAVSMLVDLKNNVDRSWAATINSAMYELNKIQNYIEKEQGGGAAMEEGRYHRTPYQGDDPRAKAFEQAQKILDDLMYDSIEGDVAEYADEAMRNLSKAIEELEYQRNQVGNVNEKRK